MRECDYISLHTYFNRKPLMLRDQLLQRLDEKLEPWRFHDYAPNGLQVEGRTEIKKIIAGVTASQALIDAAIAKQADAILVHHGYFWKGEPPQLTGIKKTRVKSLLINDINLIAYHLPLDAHPELGNNAQLARMLNWQVAGQCGEQALVWYGTPAESLTAQALADQLSCVLDRQALLLGNSERVVRRLAWCTGGAQNYFTDAIALGVDVFICGEVSEQHFHLANESGVTFIAAGHHATERYGICALGDWLAEQEDLQVTYLEFDNPV